MRMVCCDRCDKRLYRITDNGGVASVNDLDDDEFEIPKPPAVVVVQDRRYIFCSKKCLLDKLATLPEDGFKAGYPIL